VSSNTFFDIFSFDFIYFLDILIHFEYIMRHILYILIIHFIY